MRHKKLGLSIHSCRSSLNLRFAAGVVGMALLFSSVGVAQPPGSHAGLDRRFSSAWPTSVWPPSEKDDGGAGPLFGESFTVRQQSSSPIATVHELSHQVPGRAEREFDRAWKARNKGALEKAIQHFEAAIAIDPEFAAALNDLGMTYLHLQRLDSAIKQFSKAIAVDAHAAMPP